MRRLLAASVTTAAVAALLCAAPAHAASSTSANQWASGVCSAVQTFGDSVKSTLTGLKSASSLDDASQKAKSGLDDATQQLESSLKALGKPSTSDGGKAQSAVQNLSKELKNDVSDVEDLLSPPASTPQEIASTFSQIGSEVQHAVDQVQSTATTLKGLKPNGTLQKAFQNSSSCQKLKSEL
jgi:phage-related protein